MKDRSNMLLPMNLQLFASDADEETKTDDTGEQGADEKKSFDEILEDADYQEEFKKRVQQAVSEQKEKWQSTLDEELTEAEKLAKMTKEQKREYLANKKEKELTDREAEITKKELMAEAKGTLAEKNLPVSLAKLLNYSSAEECSKSIEVLESAFAEAVEKTVQDKIRGSAVPKKAGGNNLTLEQQIMKAMKAQ